MVGADVAGAEDEAPFAGALAANLVARLSAFPTG
jgi:hypothetical protein